MLCLTLFHTIYAVLPTTNREEPILANTFSTFAQNKAVDPKFAVFNPILSYIEIGILNKKDLIEELLRIPINNEQEQKDINKSINEEKTLLKELENLNNSLIHLRQKPTFSIYGGKYSVNETKYFEVVRGDLTSNILYSAIVTYRKGLQKAARELRSIKPNKKHTQKQKKTPNIIFLQKLSQIFYDLHYGYKISFDETIVGLNELNDRPRQQRTIFKNRLLEFLLLCTAQLSDDLKISENYIKNFVQKKLSTPDLKENFYKMAMNRKKENITDSISAAYLFHHLQVDINLAPKVPNLIQELNPFYS